MPIVPTRLGDVSYETQGSGVPVVLLHATLHDRHDYDQIVPKLAKQFQTIAVDWPWHGESKGIETFEGLSAVALADVLEDIVCGLNLAPAFFIGNSVGGFAAARLAIKQPSCVRGLVLVNCGGFHGFGLFRRVMCRIIGTSIVARLLFPVAVPAYMAAQNDEDHAITARSQQMARTPVGAAVAAALWRSFPDPGHDLRSQAAQIRAPTLVTWGSKDVVFTPDDAKAVRECIPGARLEMFETGHVVFASKPDAFLDVVVVFLRQIAGNDAVIL